MCISLDVLPISPGRDRRHVDAAKMIMEKKKKKKRGQQEHEAPSPGGSVGREGRERRSASRVTCLDSCGRHSQGIKFGGRWLCPTRNAAYVPRSSSRVANVLSGREQLHTHRVWKRTKASEAVIVPRSDGRQSERHKASAGPFRGRCPACLAVSIPVLHAASSIVQSCSCVNPVQYTTNLHHKCARVRHGMPTGRGGRMPKGEVVEDAGATISRFPFLSIRKHVNDERWCRSHGRRAPRRKVRATFLSESCGATTHDLTLTYQLGVELGSIQRQINVKVHAIEGSLGSVHPLEILLEVLPTQVRRKGDDLFDAYGRRLAGTPRGGGRTWYSRGSLVYSGQTSSSQAYRTSSYIRVAPGATCRKNETLTGSPILTRWPFWTKICLVYFQRSFPSREWGGGKVEGKQEDNLHICASRCGTGT
nr:hypothetical protein CFP56_54932 [Quercus suber]